MDFDFQEIRVMIIANIRNPDHLWFFLWFFTDGGIHLGYFPFENGWAEYDEYVCFFVGWFFYGFYHTKSPFCTTTTTMWENYRWVIFSHPHPTVANLRISFKHRFFWGGTLQFLGDAFFTEMEFVISRCPFDLSKIFWNDSVSGTTCELRKFPSRRQLSSMEIQQIWQEINRQDVMFGVPRRSVTGNWTKKKCQNSKSSEDLGFLHIWWWFYGSSFGVVFSPMLSPLPTKFKHLPFWSTA